MTQTTALRLRRLASPRRQDTASGTGHRAAALLLRLACAALLAWIGYIHLHLWLEGYRQIPTDGPLFLLDAAAGFALAVALLAWPRPLAGLAAAGYIASDVGALLISLTVGLFGFKESISAAYVVQTLIIEAIALLALLALLSWTVLVAAAPGHRLAAAARRPASPCDRDSQAAAGGDRPHAARPSWRIRARLSSTPVAAASFPPRTRPGDAGSHGRRNRQAIAAREARVATPGACRPARQPEGDRARRSARARAT
ncbi:MAG TPA: hypothetical protein VIY52_28765 [Streptosporangiaceae bacterium]